MVKNTICWVINNLKSGAQLCRPSFSNKYIQLSKDINNNDCIELVDKNGQREKWNANYADLFADDWMIYSEDEIDYPYPENLKNFITGVLTIGHNYDEPSKQNNFGFYSKWSIGSFDLIATDLFNKDTCGLSTLCSYTVKNAPSGIMLALYQTGAGGIYKEPWRDRNVHLRVYIGNDIFVFKNPAKGPSNYLNYWWDEELGSSDGMTVKHFIPNIDKKIKITLEFFFDK